MTEGQRFVIYIAVLGGAAYYLLRKPSLPSAGTTGDRAGVTVGADVAQDQDYTGAGGVGAGAFAGAYDVLSTYYGAASDGGAAGVETDPYANIDNSRLFDPYQQEYDIYNAYHPNGEGPTLEGA